MIGKLCTPSRINYIPALALTLAACSSDTGTGDRAGGERISTSQSALTEQFVDSFDTNNFIAFLFVQQLQQSTLIATNGHIVFTPTSFLMSKLNLTALPSFDVPQTAQAFDDVDVAVSALNATVDMSTLDFEIVGSDLMVNVSGSGSANIALTYHSPLGDISVHPTLSVPTFNISLKVGWKPAAERLFIERGGAIVTMPGANISGCGLLGWCNGIGNSHMGDLAAGLSGALTTALFSEFDPPEPTVPDATVAFEAFSLSICSLAAPDAPPAGRQCLVLRLLRSGDRAHDRFELDQLHAYT